MTGLHGKAARPATSLVLPILAALLASCGVSEDEASSASQPAVWSASSSSLGTDSGEDPEEPTRGPFDEDDAREAAESEISDETYAGIGLPYGCREDCSGHEAGFRYRAENGYVGYNADSPSFNEGGQAFEDAVEERIEEMKQEYESGGDSPY